MLKIKLNSILKQKQNKGTNAYASLILNWIKVQLSKFRKYTFDFDAVNCEHSMLNLCRIFSDNPDMKIVVPMYEHHLIYVSSNKKLF